VIQIAVWDYYMIFILIPNLSFRLHSFIVLVALKRAVLLDLGQCLNTDSLGTFFFRKSFAAVLHLVKQVFRRWIR
jgi:hypothetical protein